MENMEHGILAVLRREVDRMTSRFMFLLLLVIIPLFCFIFFATIMPTGMPKELPIGIVDHDNSIVSRNMVRQIGATSANTTVRYTNYAEARDLVQRGKLYGCIVIPKDFERDVSFGNQPRLMFYYNAVYLTAGSVTLSNVSTMLGTLTGAVNLKTRQARGQTLEQSMGQIQPIVPTVHPIGNPQLNYAVYLINVLIPGILELLIILTTVYSIGEELKRRTSREWIQIADGSLSKALIGKLLPYLLVFVVQAFVYLTILFKILHFPLNVNIGWMLLNAMLLVMASQCLGVLFIGILPVQRDALSLSSLYGVLAFSFSGFTFPIESMLSWVQGLSCIFPLRFYFRIYQKMALNGLDWYYEWQSFAALLVFLILPALILPRLKEACVYMQYPKG